MILNLFRSSTFIFFSAFGFKMKCFLHHCVFCQEETLACGNLRLYVEFSKLPGNDQTQESSKRMWMQISKKLITVGCGGIVGKMSLVMFCGCLQHTRQLHPIMAALRCVWTCCFGTRTASGRVVWGSIGFFLISDLHHVKQSKGFLTNYTVYKDCASFTPLFQTLSNGKFISRSPVVVVSQCHHCDTSIFLGS